MSVVRVLRPEVGVWLDPRRLADFYARHGQARAEAMMARAMADLAQCLAALVQHYADGDLSRFSRELNQLRALADEMGMVGLVQAAEAVDDCLGRPEGTALAATWARLTRVGQQALTIEWDLRGISH